jgi:23S rRNA maturation-related 3'-5' exoribonuclease YhaM
MTIQDIFKMEDGVRVSLNILLSDKKTQTKKDGSSYLTASVQDVTGKLEFPVWDDFTITNELLQLNQVYTLKGVVSHFGETLQVKNPKFTKVNGEVDLKQFVPTYDIPSYLIQDFLKTIDKMDTKWKSIAMAATGALGYDKKRWKSFTTCVSASSHHGNKRGGLFLHTMGVLKAVNSMIDRYVTAPFYTDAKDVINPDRLRCKAIVHDLKKDEEYEFDGIIRHKKDLEYDHTINGVVYMHKINDEVGNVLTEEELQDLCYAIMSHHGQWGAFQPKDLEDILLHLADMEDAKIVGAAEEAERNGSKTN